MTKKVPTLILIVLDGFGCRDETEWNAIAQADAPTFRRLFSESPWTTLHASGLHVGLPDGQMGNSEVGHLNIGAGRIVDQDIVRISKAVDKGDLSRNPVLVSAFERLERTDRRIHFVGLLSDGGVHSLQHHLHGLIRAAIDNGMSVRDDRPSVFIHAILDGRDTPPMSARRYIRGLLDFIDDKPQTHLSTIIGRYYTMDRDKRWERVKRGYDLMTLGIGTETTTPFGAIDRHYEEGITDEFMEPMALLLPDGSHRGKIQDGDTVVFFNFRADRMRQIVTAFMDEELDGFERSILPRAELITMNRYHEQFDLPVLFPPAEIRNHLGEVFSDAGLRQLRIAETEKYAHVTFFFNGGSDRISKGEDRILIPSPKVATYDKQPEMSLPELSDRVVSEIENGTYDVIVLNIANPDMVGHTGVMEAAVRAVEATDAAVGRILEAVTKTGGIAIITADHGNCETMFDFESKQPHTAHTTSPVPLIVFDPEGRVDGLAGGGSLENVAPTILAILGLARPPEMTAESLLEGESTG
ncbi:MAG TPA: 2,3-bisphosphoglycerate-independent phosphoglycerate mutase [Thermoanaerobaculia bacterium]|nr:2,3-bisphosphoglycerate-independent phosphoglycerate mutase [Thermoanaerobaculia bacterium]